MNILAKVIVFVLKCLLFYYVGLYLGLGNYDSESSLLVQNWKVYLFLYLPLAMGTEGLITTLLEAIRESKEEQL